MYLLSLLLPPCGLTITLSTVVYWDDIEHLKPQSFTEVNLELKCNNTNRTQVQGWRC